MIAEGERALGFTLPDQDGQPVSLCGLAGRPVVLYFNPKADTCRASSGAVAVGRAAAVVPATQRSQQS